MVTVNIIPATYDHIAYVAENIRDADKAEIWASHRYTPLQALKLAVAHSETAFAGVVDGEPICIWGVHRESLILSAATPWMIGSKRLDRFAKTFITHCRPQINAMFARYKELKNFVDARNTRAIRWLKWLGFNVNPIAQPYGALQMPFHEFTMRIN